MSDKPKDYAVDEDGVIDSALAPGGPADTSSSTVSGSAGVLPGSLAVGLAVGTASGPGKAELKAPSAVSTVSDYGAGEARSAVSKGLVVANVKPFAATGFGVYGGGVDLSPVVFGLQRDFNATRFQVQSATPSPWVLASSKKTS